MIRGLYLGARLLNASRQVAMCVSLSSPDVGREVSLALPKPYGCDAQPDARRTLRTLWLGLCFGSILLLIGLLRNWHDALVLIGTVALVAGRIRRVLAVSTVLLVMVSFPPFSWPTWWFCLAPMLWMWRDPALKISGLRLTAEAVVVGFTMGWLSTGFVRAGVPAWGWLIHAAGCLVFSLQFVAIAITVRLMRKQPVVVAAGVTAVVAVGGELFEAWCGVSWSVTNLALTVGASPLAQWSRWITPFGVSGFLYFVSFLLSVDRSSDMVSQPFGAEFAGWKPAPHISRMLLRRWIGPTMGVAILVLAWCGGGLIAANTPIDPLPFSVLLVQPHLKVSDNEPWRPWLHLDRMTQASLLRRDAVDLIVWPESCLSESSGHGSPSGANDVATQLTVQDFSRLMTPNYGTNCLVGVVMAEQGTTQRYGLEVAELRRYNCGCLVAKSGTIGRHEKLDLVPFKEGLPGLFDCAWVRNQLLPRLQLSRRLAYGRQYAPLSFRDREGNLRRIAVSVCYESLLPWLPQYRESADVDAIVHIVYDGNSAEHPGMMERHIRACQYRAIETRKWNLVCSTWSGSTIIDPSGKIVRQLSATEGVLQTDIAD